MGSGLVTAAIVRPPSRRTKTAPSLSSTSTRVTSSPPACNSPAAVVRSRATVASLSVARFEDTKLYRAKFDGALIVRTVFADARLGATSMEKADFSGARLIDVSMRGANLMAASFARAMLIGVDLRDAALAGADFSGATTIGCHLPAEFGS